MSTFSLTLALLNNRHVLAALGALAVVGLVLLFRSTPLRAQTSAYFDPANPTINVGERISIGAYDVPVGQTAYIRMTGPIKPEGRCGARSVAQPRAPGPSTGTGYYDSLWIDGCSQGTGHLRLETQDGSTVFARTTVIVRGPPSTVRGLDVIPGSRKLTLRWAKPTNNGGAALTGYQVQNNQATPGWPGGSSVIENPDTTSFKVEPLLPDTTYQVRVRACNAASLCSDWVYGSGTTPADTTAPTPTPTPTPTATVPPVVPPTQTPPGLVRDFVVIEESGQLKLKWKIPSSIGSRPITGYQVQNDEGTPGWPGGSSVIDESVHSDIATREKLEFTVAPLTNGTTYKVRVRACNGECGNWWTKEGTPPGTTTPVATAPGPITDLSVTIDGGTLTLSWSAPHDGGSAITRYEVQYKEDSSDTWLSAPNVTGTRTTISVTGDRTYDAQVRACNDIDCGIWSAGETPPEPITTQPLGPVALGETCKSVAAAPAVQPGAEPTRLDKPTGLEIVPYPARRAALVWNAVADVSNYVVKVRQFGGDTDWQVATDGNPTKPCHEIDLDEITPSSGPQGLAEHKAFEFQVTATFGPLIEGDNPIVSNPSDSIVVIDTPITKANGHSPGSTGQAELTWDPLAGILGTGWSGGTYSFRYRRFAGDHTALPWTPATFDSASAGTVSQNPITELTLLSVYAIQLRYEQSGRAPVFAARDVYVRPSGAPPADGSVVATFPLQRRVPYDKNYKYHICEETFAPEGKMRVRDWGTLIDDAFLRWQAAMDELITVTGVRGGCTPYQRHIDRIVPRIDTVQQSSLPQDQIEETVKGLLNNLKTNVMSLGPDDRTISEVLMLDDRGGLFDRLDVTTFADISNDLGYRKDCWFKEVVVSPPGVSYYKWDESTLMCTHPPAVSGGTSDIIIRRSKFENDLLQVPESDAMFNNCGNESDNANSAYRSFLHEVGHALGIKHPLGDPRKAGQAGGQITDSVMNYVDEPGCAPYPFDQLAIYALYQSR